MATFSTGEVLREDIITNYSKSGVNSPFEDILYTSGGGERVVLQLLDFKFYLNAFIATGTVDMIIEKSLTSTGGLNGAPPNILSLVEGVSIAGVGETTFYTEGATTTATRYVDYNKPIDLGQGDKLIVRYVNPNGTANLDFAARFSLKKYTLFTSYFKIDNFDLVVILN